MSHQKMVFGYDVIIVVHRMSTTSSSSSSSGTTLATSSPQESTGSRHVPASVEYESADEKERGDPFQNPTQQAKPNANEDHEKERRDPFDSEIPEWLQKFRENLVNGRVTEPRDSHASSFVNRLWCRGEEWYLVVTVLILTSRKTETAKSVRGLKLQVRHAEHVLCGRKQILTFSAFFALNSSSSNRILSSQELLILSDSNFWRVWISCAVCCGLFSHEDRNSTAQIHTAQSFKSFISIVVVSFTIHDNICVCFL